MKTMKRVLSLITAAVLMVSVYTISVGAVSIDDFISDESAMAAALEFTGGGQAVGCKLVYNNGDAQYEINIINEGMSYVIYVDAYSGSIISFTRETTVLSSASAAQNTAPQTPVSTPAPERQPQSSVQTASDGSVGSIALNHVGQGTVVRTEQKYSKRSGSFHKVCINSGNWHYDVHVFADGTVITAKMREIQYTSKKASWNGGFGAIGFDRAASIAQDRAGGGVIIKNELDYKSKEGVYIYKVDVVIGQTEHKFEINGSTGAVIKYNTKYWQ